jgi:hypothetical protein
MSDVMKTSFRCPQCGGEFHPPRFTLPQIAARFGVSRRTMQRWIKTYDIKCIRLLLPCDYDDDPPQDVCQGCGFKFPERWIYRPKDHDLLADALNLSPQILDEMIQNGQIPVLYEMDRLGRRRGVVISIWHAFEALGTSGRVIQ